MSKSSLGFLVGSFALVLMLLISPVIAIPQDNGTYINSNSLDSDLNLEFANIVAGNDLATYSSVFIFGGHDGTTMPIDDSVSGFSETAGWLVISAQLSNYADYLNRIPFETADGLSLLLAYPESVSGTSTLSQNAVGYVNALYGVNMTEIYHVGGFNLPNFYVFYDENGHLGDVSDDVVAVDNDGFSNLLNTNTITDSPVSWAGYGARNLAGSRVGMHGAGWVTPSGLTKSGDVYTLSSAAILGDVNAASAPSDGLSRLQFHFPYPISPVANGITPDTSNPLPHVTGQMMWDLRHPISSYSLPDAADFSVSYELDVSLNFPNVQNKMSINQTKLNNDGIMEVMFDLENIGLEDAKNVNLSLPLGPDFGKIVDKNITIYTIRDGLTINETENESFNLALNVNPDPQSQSFDFKLFELDGWYTVDANGSKPYWNESVTELSLFNGSITITGIGSLSVNLAVTNPGGFPDALIDAVNTNIVPNMPTTLTSLNELSGPLKDNLAQTLKETFNDSFTSIYQEEDKLIFDEGDFTLVQKDVAITAAVTEQRYFLEANLATLASGASTSLSFRLNDVPTTADELALMEFTKGTTSDGYPTATLSSKLQNYNEFMQYAFELFGFDGRPLSFNLPDNYVLDFDGLFWSDTYGTLGMAFTYENAAGYPFFGLSNGQNFQIADDEAVVAATVSLDQQNYEIGDPVEITVDLENFGDTAASDVKVHLYHSTIGRDWRFERIDKIDEISVDDIAANGQASVTFTGEANTYLGYHTVFAFVEFDSDAGQTDAVIPDFLDLGVTSFQGAGETHHFVMSTLSGALVLPQNFLPQPSIPEPILEVTSTISPTELSVGDTFTYTVTITNTGSAPTNATLNQAFNKFEVELGTVTAPGTVYTTPGSVFVDEFPVDVDQTVTVSIEFTLLSSSATLPPAIVAFSTSGDSSLGNSVNTGVSMDVAANPMLGLSAGAAAQQASQSSGSQDSSSSSYSASSSVGASVNTDEISQSAITAGSNQPGFVGYGPELLGLILAPMVFVGFVRRRK